jgi:hypothetical protein
LSVFSPRENLPSRFKFKEYCPMVFRNLRERFGIDDQDYQVQAVLAKLKDLSGEEGCQEATAQVERKKCWLSLCCISLQPYQSP